MNVKSSIQASRQSSMIPIEDIDIPASCFGLSEQEYQACSPAHIAAGFTTAPDGKRMSINVAIIGGSLMVQHYVETFGRKDHLLLDSVSDGEEYHDETYL